MRCELGKGMAFPPSPPWRTLALVALHLSLLGLPLPAASQVTRGSVEGNVVERETGLPLVGATVRLAPEPQDSAALSLRVVGEDGAFLFQDVPPGAYSLTAGLIGYHTSTDRLVVEAGSSMRIVMELSASPIALDSVVVVATRSPFMRDFEARRSRAVGTFITRDEIEATNPHVFSEILRTVPSVRYAQVGRLGRIEIRMRDGCIPAYWVNGAPIHDSTIQELGIDLIVSPQEVEAIEVYRSAGAVPPQFGPEPCGAVVIWTRQREAVGGNSWKQVIFAAGIVLGIFLMR